MIEELPRLFLYAFVVGSLLYHLHRSAGGLTGLWHARVREPLLAAIGAGVLLALGGWVGDTDPAEGAVDWRGMRLLLMLFALLMWFIAMAFLDRGLADRRKEVERIADELDTLLDPTDTHFVLDASNAHRPMELLEELAQLIGPGRYAPGQPWATHQWIADRMAAARAVKPAEPSHRIEKSTS